MNKTMTFIVPLKHPDSCKDWNNVVTLLKETAQSIENACKESSRANAIVVANDEAELPALPECFDVHRVSLPPPSVSVFFGETPETERANAVRWDKGYKLATGAIKAKEAGADYIMCVDADDLVSKNIPSLIEKQPNAFGWYVEKGWLLPVGSKWGVIVFDFHNWCGTYAIVRTDLLPLPASVDDMDPETVKNLFGHHRELIPELEKQGTPLTPISYPAAVYRIGHSDGNYRRGKLSQDALSLSKFFESPVRYMKRLSNVRPFGKAHRLEFEPATNQS